MSPRIRPKRWKIYTYRATSIKNRHAWRCYDSLLHIRIVTSVFDHPCRLKIVKDERRCCVVVPRDKNVNYFHPWNNNNNEACPLRSIVHPPRSNFGTTAFLSASRYFISEYFIKMLCILSAVQRITFEETTHFSRKNANGFLRATPSR